MRRTFGFKEYAAIQIGFSFCRALRFGEEQTYMSVWAMTFLVNTFGVEALQQVSRKALFIYVMQRANGLMKTRWGGVQVGTLPV